MTLAARLVWIAMFIISGCVMVAVVIVGSPFLAIGFVHQRLRDWRKTRQNPFRQTKTARQSK